MERSLAEQDLAAGELKGIFPRIGEAVFAQRRQARMASAGVRVIALFEGDRITIHEGSD
jgi:hypothetical protein